MSAQTLTSLILCLLPATSAARANPGDDIVPIDPNTPSILDILLYLLEMLRGLL